MNIPTYTSVMQKLMHWPQRDMGLFLMVCAALLYGAFGYPTPDSMGGVEWAIAAMVLAAFFLSRPWSFLSTGGLTCARLFLVFGLSVPLIMAVVSGNAPRAIVRDVIPFLFMMMPVLYGGLLRDHNQRFLMGAVLGVGILFSLRCVFPNDFLGQSSKLDYLANMPSVLMAAIFFAGFAIFNFCARFDLKSLVWLPFFLGLSALCLWPVLATVQRASTGVYALCVLGVLLVCFLRFPKRAAVLSGGLALCLGMTMPFFAPSLDALAQKNILVGSNMRLAELAAVWQEISQTPLGVLFGQGWGAEYASPAVAGITVNYTHSLLSALILKTGLAGLFLGLLYLGVLVKGLVENFYQNPVIILAIFGPLFIDIFLYASYKSLDFGLVLMLAAAVREEYKEGNV